ncbi:hypothetical protein [Nocardioides sp. LML1-1-1.1]|uniref:hypothetical protein n=1 Tax=Nocardioides sp. LML1-1-1.1 TaxID=3135248 RepID=UPI00341D0112
MAPDPSVLGSNLVLGPLALIGFIVAALGYAAKEYRKAREQRVEDAVAQRDQEREDHSTERRRLEQERDDARADAVAIDQKLDEANDQIRDLKENEMRKSDAMFARLVRAREMLVERGVLPEDLP